MALSEEDVKTICWYAEQLAKCETGVDLISAERKRQTSVEGWTPEHDDSHAEHELSDAAMCYLSGPAMCSLPDVAPPSWWPWDVKWWKPKDRISNLVRAGALIAAEIDRLKRIALAEFKAKLKSDADAARARENETAAVAVAVMLQDCGVEITDHG